ncbi:hypothetical protein HK096_005974, partial [Nowakowskiella sp. JEL0078]
FSYDVYWASNQQLLEWIANPTTISKTLNSTTGLGNCLTPATASGNQEVCDGVDNTGSGKIDSGLSIACSFASQNVYFSSCYGCPTIVPNTSQPVPPLQSVTRKLPNADICPNAGTWDPVAGQCVQLKRASRAAIRTPTSSTSSTSTSTNKNSSSSAFPITDSTWKPMAFALVLMTLAIL